MGMKLACMISMKHCLNTLLIIGILCFAAAGVAPATEPITVTGEAMAVKLLERINFARENPVEAAALIGVDAQQVIVQLPDLKDIFQNGLPALEKSDQLKETAEVHTREMLAHNFYSRNSIDGSSPYERAERAGYEPVAVGESLGIVGFANYMKPDAAVDILFANLLRDELNAARTSRRNILNPLFTDIGIAVGTGVMTLGAGERNVYLLTCDFGTNDVPVVDTALMAVQLLQLINQARSLPLKAAANTGIPAEEMLSLHFDIAGVLQTGMPPVGMTETLADVAAGHVADMVDNHFIGQQSSDGRLFPDRLAAREYDGFPAGERILFVPFTGDMTQETLLEQVFDALMNMELDKESIGDYLIFNPDVNEVGIAVGLGSFLAEDGNRVRGLVLAVDFGFSTDDQKLFLTGAVFRDRDQNGWYVPAEASEHRNLVVFGAGLHLTTDGAGGFGAKVDPGYYWVILFGQDGELSIQEVRVADKNIRVPFVENPM